MYIAPQTSRHQAVHLSLGLEFPTAPEPFCWKTFGKKRQATTAHPGQKSRGRIFDINLSGDDALDHLVSGPTLTVVTVPANASTDLLDRDLGFGKYGYDLTFHASDHPTQPEDRPVLTIAIYIPAASDLPISVNIVPRQGFGWTEDQCAICVEGMTNSWITVVAA